MSATDIDKGTRWREEVGTALDTMKAGIICLTPENLSAEWLLFEAGALSKTRDLKTRVSIAEIFWKAALGPSWIALPQPGLDKAIASQSACAVQR